MLNSLGPLPSAWRRNDFQSLWLFNMATAGIGSWVHLAGELFMTMTGNALQRAHIPRNVFHGTSHKRWEGRAPRQFQTVEEGSGPLPGKLLPG